MATRPTEPTLLGKFFDYPQEATGTVVTYWLDSSPDRGHLVRMTGACKRAFLATIEAVIERAHAPANSGSNPGVNTNFKTIALGANGIGLLIAFTRWSSVADRAGLGARLKRGCPREDWNALVRHVAALWHPEPFSLMLGTVYAWQMEMLSYDTGGFRAEVDGRLYITDMNQLQDLIGYFADEDAYVYGVPERRPWGAFPGGNMLTPMSDWIVDSLVDLGANTDTGTGTAMKFTEEQLTGMPVPLKAGHEGNWFGSSTDGIVGENISARRSSSAWAVLQAMLANMRFTHLRFRYYVTYGLVIEYREIVRRFDMDENGDLYAVQVSDTEIVDSTFTDNKIYSSSDWSASTTGTPYVQVWFNCSDQDVENSPLVLYDYPEDTDGWWRVGAAMPHLGFGESFPGEARITLSRTRPAGVSDVMLDSQVLYPSDGMLQYLDQYGHVTFVDALSFYSGQDAENLVWRKFSVRGEIGNRDLTVPVRAHANWLFNNEVPMMPWPTIPACPSRLGEATRIFWDGWAVLYPQSPNVRVNGRDAYFPIRFANKAWVDNQGWPIRHNDLERAWEGGSGSGQGAILGPAYQLTFPDLGDIPDYGPRKYVVESAPDAMAAYQWKFKAMPV